MKRLIAFAAVIAVALTACVTGPEVTPDQQVPAASRSETEAPSPGRGEQVLTFVAGDIFYDDPPTSARAGTLTIVIRNTGKITHNVAFEGFNDEQPVVEAPAGGTDTGEITLEEGSYVFYCSIPGHREAGMEGTLEVSP